MNRYVVIGVLCLVLMNGVRTMSAEEEVLGGYSPVLVTKKEVVDAAAFAVSAKEKELKPAEVKLVEILKAEEQIVAGANYRMKLKVEIGGEEKEAVVVVWWQAWRKPEPYELTSWE